MLTTRISLLRSGNLASTDNPRGDRDKTRPTRAFPNPLGTLRRVLDSSGGDADTFRAMEAR